MRRGAVVIVVNFGTEPVTTEVGDGLACCSRPSQGSSWRDVVTLPAHAGALLAPR